MKYIDKDKLLEWIHSEKDKVINNITAKGKKLSSSATPREYERVKSLDAFMVILDQFETAEAEMLELAQQQLMKKTREKYSQKLVHFYETEGKTAIDFAIELRRQGLGYQRIANKLETAGYKTVNGRDKWTSTQVMRKLKERGIE